MAKKKINGLLDVNTSPSEIRKQIEEMLATIPKGKHNNPRLFVFACLTDGSDNENLVVHDKIGSVSRALMHNPMLNVVIASLVLHRNEHPGPMDEIHKLVGHMTLESIPALSQDLEFIKQKKIGSAEVYPEDDEPRTPEDMPPRKPDLVERN